MRLFEMIRERGVKINVEKAEAWFKGRRRADNMALMFELIPDALERNDLDFLLQFPWIEKVVDRPAPRRVRDAKSLPGLN